MEQPSISATELLPALDAVLAQVTSSPEASTASVDVQSSNWFRLAWLLCTVVGWSRILTPQDLWRRRLKVVAAVADWQVDYYEQLMASKGSAWANGLRRAKEFRTLVKAEECSPAALNEFSQVLEAESKSEGSGFWSMWMHASWAAEPMRNMAT